MRYWGSISCSILFEEELGKSCIAECFAYAVTKDERQAPIAGIGIVMVYWGRGYVVAAQEVTAMVKVHQDCDEACKLFSTSNWTFFFRYSN